MHARKNPFNAKEQQHCNAAPCQIQSKQEEVRVKVKTRHGQTSDFLVKRQVFYNCETIVAIHPRLPCQHEFIKFYQRDNLMNGITWGV